MYSFGCKSAEQDNSKVSVKKDEEIGKERLWEREYCAIAVTLATVSFILFVYSFLALAQISTILTTEGIRARMILLSPVFIAVGAILFAAVLGIMIRGAILIYDRICPTTYVLSNDGEKDVRKAAFEIVNYMLVQMELGREYQQAFWDKLTTEERENQLLEAAEALAKEMVRKAVEKVAECDYVDYDEEHKDTEASNIIGGRLNLKLRDVKLELMQTEKRDFCHCCGKQYLELVDQSQEGGISL